MKRHTRSVYVDIRGDTVRADNSLDDPNVLRHPVLRGATNLGKPTDSRALLQAVRALLNEV